MVTQVAANELVNVEDDQSLELKQLQLPGYKFTTKIGEGGMAAVYKGQQLSLARPVAIKVLNQTMRENDNIYQAFEREAVIIARLNHPNIIHVIDRGIGESGTPFFIMEYIDGVDLATMMRDGQLPLQKKIEICVQICKALSYAHRNGVVHRDVKPANILVDDEFNAKVLDFGIALFCREDNSLATNNKDSSVSDSEIVGTYNYMAPELKTSVVTATDQSDIYSLGIVMYELFAGYFPNSECLLKPPEQTGLPENMAKLVMACLAESPADRPKSMIDVHDRLLQLLHGSHLNKKQVQRANDTFKKKSFSLLDVIRETKKKSIYLFIEKNSGQQFVVKKITGAFQGYETAQSLAKLSHKNIVQVHGASKNERTFIVVMDYVRGGSLQDRLLKPYKMDDFLRLANQMCQGLIKVHSLNILHGNLRPTNILFDTDDNVKISGFGIKPKNIDQQEIDAGGKKLKSSPRDYKLLQEPLCPQSDIYALGMIFHIMLIGNLPRYSNLEFNPGRAFKRLPPSLQDILRKMLKYHVVDRPATMQEVAQVINQFDDDMPTEVWSKDRKEQHFDEPVRKNNWAKYLYCVVVSLAVVLTLAYVTSTFLPVEKWLSTILEKLSGF